MEENIKKTLEEQLQLLSERSKNAPIQNLAEITAQMVSVAKMLSPEHQSQYCDEAGHLPFVGTLTLSDLAEIASARNERANRQEAALREELARSGIVVKSSPKDRTSLHA